MAPEPRNGVIADDREGDEDKRAADLARRNGGPGIVPGGVRKTRTVIIDVKRLMAEESDCLRRFYEESGGDQWKDHKSWQKLLVQLRTPDGKTVELDRIANMPSSEMEHFRDELLGCRAKWVNKTVFPASLTRVIELRLPSNNIVGPIPQCLSELIHLRRLEFPENQLSGPIPGFLGNTLLELRHVDLSYNMLTGDLPTFGVRFISFLKCIRVNDNAITGRLSVLSGNLTELTTMALHNNRIGGSLPDSMTNMKKLEQLTFHNNKVRGPIPKGLGMVMPNLRVLTLSTNKLTGAIPTDSLACCPHLMMLTLDGNRFTFDGEEGSRDQVFDYLRSRLGKTATVAL